jgi:hypothetical protein
VVSGDTLVGREDGPQDKGLQLQKSGSSCKAFQSLCRGYPALKHTQECPPVALYVILP